MIAAILELTCGAPPLNASKRALPQPLVFQAESFMCFQALAPRFNAPLWGTTACSLLHLIILNLRFWITVCWWFGSWFTAALVRTRTMVTTERGIARLVKEITPFRLLVEI